MMLRGLLLAVSIGLAALAPGPARSESAPTWTGDVPIRQVPLPSLQRRYPVTYNAASLQAAYSNPKPWDSRAASVEGTVLSVVFNQRQQPSIELALSTAPETTIWAPFPLIEQDQNMDAFLKVGAKLRIVGWLGETSKLPRDVRLDLPRQRPLTLIAICLVIVRNSNFVFDGNYAEDCEAWQKGFMPPDRASK